MHAVSSILHLMCTVLVAVLGDVLDQLSDKVSKVERLEMTPFQRQVYDGILSGYAQRKEVRKAKVREQIALDELMDCKSKKKREPADEQQTKTKRTAKAGGATLQLLWKGTPSAKQETIDLTESGSGIKPEVPMDDIVDLSHETKSPDVAAKVDPGEVESLLKAMNASEVNHLFTTLRKAANHPLLLRIRYKDEQVLNKIAMV
jgi:SNF2 family DNA or RNA helicase